MLEEGSCQLCRVSQVVEQPTHRTATYTSAQPMTTILEPIATRNSRIPGYLRPRIADERIQLNAIIPLGMFISKASDGEKPICLKMIDPKDEIGPLGT